MPFWLLSFLILLGLVALVVPPYLVWWNWWDKRMEQQAIELFPDDADEQQRATWQLLRALEGPRFIRLLKLDGSDFYARHFGKTPK